MKKDPLNIFSKQSIQRSTWRNIRKEPGPQGDKTDPDQWLYDSFSRLKNKVFDWLFGPKNRSL